MTPEPPKDAPSPEDAAFDSSQPNVGLTPDSYVKQRRPYSRIATELEPEELSQKGVQKMVIAEIARLETENAQLRSFESRYYIAHTSCEVLKAQRAKYTMTEILYTVGIAAGAALLGWLPSLPMDRKSLPVALVAVALLLASVVAKWVGEKRTKPEANDAT